MSHGLAARAAKPYFGKELVHRRLIQQSCAGTIRALAGSCPLFGVVARPWAGISTLPLPSTTTTPRLVWSEIVLSSSGHRSFSNTTHVSGDSSSEVGRRPSSDASAPSKPTVVAVAGKETSIVANASDVALRASKTLLGIFARSPGIIWYYLTHPRELRKKLAEFKQAAFEEIQHYWMGSKLLAADVRTARQIMGRTLRGSTLSRRERKQLLRTVTDVFRLVPMSVFVLIPFMEFALPFALKIFPNMLPSTFQDSLKEEEKMKGELRMRIGMAGFFQDTLAELAKEQKKKFARTHDNDDDGLAEDNNASESDEEATATSFLEFLKKARSGEAIPPEVIIKFAKYFEDNLTLDNMGRGLLVNMCKYMGIPPYGNDNLLRFQLRHRIRLLKDDDQRILWEGIESLTKMELREACRERGMRSTGLSKDAYRRALQQWLDLSVQKSVPISLLIMSRTFFLHDEMVQTDVDGGSGGVSELADAMSGIDKKVVNEVILEMASSEEKSKNADVMKIQLEVLEHQNEMIKEEQEERDAAAKEKEEKEKVKEEQEEIEAKERKENEVADDQESTSHKGDMHLGGKGEVLMGPGRVVPTIADTLSSTENVPLDELTKDEVEEEEQTELSTEEIDAISQLASPDPVHREREELKRIKDKMHEEIEAESDQMENIAMEQQHGLKNEDESLEIYSAISPSEPILTEEAEEEAVKSLREMEAEIEREAKKVTAISRHGDAEAKLVVERKEGEMVRDKKLQKAIDRLKTRVESMVGKIETQLGDVEVKIGNKFHLLDRDGDGVLTMEEMAHMLRTVLKRELTAKEAMAIAADMDQNKDGVFSIAELAQWAETNTIVKLAEDGREKDLDDVITERVAKFEREEEK